MPGRCNIIFRHTSLKNTKKLIESSLCTYVWKQRRLLVIEDMHVLPLFLSLPLCGRGQVVIGSAPVTFLCNS